MAPWYAEGWKGNTLMLATVGVALLAIYLQLPTVYGWSLISALGASMVLMVLRADGDNAPGSILSMTIFVGTVLMVWNADLVAVRLFGRI